MSNKFSAALTESENLTLTENGAVTHITTGSDCLDLFSSVGALRHASEEEITRRFIRAYVEDSDTAMKILFFARDRLGLGERRTFRVILEWLARNYPESVLKNMENIPQYGRYDDLLTLLNTPCESAATEYIRSVLYSDLAAERPSLLAKWLPSVNASAASTRASAKKIRETLNLSAEEYRKILTSLRGKIKITENYLRTKDYTFDYAKQPSRAMLKYRKAFMRNDGERYLDFINAARDGKAKLHADNIAPYELAEKAIAVGDGLSEEERKVINATWNALPDYAADCDVLAVVDTSGSMYWQCAPMPGAVALSLGIYLAEHNTGAFKGTLIEFSSKPRFIALKGKNFTEKLLYAASLCDCSNTDLESVFDLILKTATKNKLEDEDLPEKLVIISDMEFDACLSSPNSTNFDAAKRKFKMNGYTLPEVVFWNANGRSANQPVKRNEKGVALVSGASPTLFKMIAGGITDPFAFMTEILSSPRYRDISA